MKLDFLVNREGFAEWARQDHRKKHGRSSHMTNDEIDRRYEIYKENFSAKQLQKFFDTEKNNEWFKEKYHPVYSRTLKEEVNKRRHELLAKFVVDLDEGKHDDVSYDAPANSTNEETTESDGKKDETQEPKDETKMEETTQTVSGNEEPIHALFIKTVPPTIKRSKIVEMVKKVPRYKYLALSDPRPEKMMHRLGWIVFEEGTDMESAISELDRKTIDTFVFHLAPHHIVEIRTRVAPAETNRPERLRHDLEQIKKLANVLDEECGILPPSGVGTAEKRLESHILPALEAKLAADADKDTEKVKKSLDLHILYLRVVHNYDYYGGIESASPEDFARRSAVYLRRQLRFEDKEPRKEWTDRLDSRIDLRIRKPIDGPEVVKLGGKSSEAELDKFLAKHVKKETEGKYRCLECSKLFKGDDFVKKHIKVKHQTVGSEIKPEVEYFNNYIRDPTKIDPSRQPGNAVGPGVGPGGNGIMPGFPMMGGPMGMPMMNPAAFQMQMQMMAQMQQMMGGTMGGMNGGGRNSGSGRRGGRGSMSSRLGPPPPPDRRNSRSDPRQIRTYNDLDNPVPSGEMELSYD
ncbi:arsenite-resistance protein 2-domain-containing protein [Phlyctochytrium arcticum]|nr:arsenite-resistance protein 2-domain-containing protein [Phlyctochytrium arcticum]